jgi:hypothetical protein
VVGPPPRVIDLVLREVIRQVLGHVARAVAAAAIGTRASRHTTT